MTTDQQEFLIVWRASEGAAVQTFASPDKTPRVYTDDASGDAQGASWADADALDALLETRKEFDKVLVSRETARRLLGWNV